jgi:hypothetical protein
VKYGRSLHKIYQLNKKFSYDFYILSLDFSCGGGIISLIAVLCCLKFAKTFYLQAFGDLFSDHQKGEIREISISLMLAFSRKSPIIL